MEEEIFLWNKYIEDIMDVYADTVYKFAFVLTGNKMDTADVFSQVFIKYIKQMPVFHNKEQEKLWFIRTTMYCIRNLWQFNYKKSRSGEKEDFTWDSKLAENISEKSLFEEYLKLIPRKYNIVLHLYYYEKMTTRQIGKLLNKKEDIIQLQLERLNHLLNEYMSRENVDLEKNYQSFLIKINADEKIKNNIKNMMIQTFRSKYSYLSKIKYRVGILLCYLVFVLLSMLIFNIQNERYLKDKSGKEVVLFQENSNYAENGIEYKEGDIVDLNIEIPGSYIGKEIELVYHDYYSGISTDVFKGTVQETLVQTFIVKEDGKADFIILDSNKQKITELVHIDYIIKRSKENK
ncbi:sigma-70 family RNA polymerase sigma factor [Anaerocolumna sedimenticola]|uniref:Sigma-70 family RNA polymerase sigma factor n=1 Tax=Anaerocolumna sedimenticola TaxID=2696063 RepID=A0A6P1TPT5_9FIRM|nr:sigma-70 family RNA polymerase sigma factor [Anaerocolumna sedimenticola]QHQ61806.1 sigma-70 family RNA polymerase sigma factor [Anaerocolumna sedimenticola]